jgi:hypothetical protein
MNRLQIVATCRLQLAGTGERVIISTSYNRHNARSPVPARKNLLFAGDSFIGGCYDKKMFMLCIYLLLHFFILC